MDSRMIETRGARTRIRVVEGGDGPDLVFMHGTQGHLADDAFLAGLARHYRVHAPLLPGFQDSAGEEALHDMLDFTLHGLDVIDALGIEKPVLVGHSMGGMIAAEMAVLNPNAFSGLVLISPFGLWLDDYPSADLFAQKPSEIAALLFKDETLGARLLTGGRDPNGEEFLRDFLVSSARQLGLAGKIMFPIPDRGLDRRLYRITPPTQIIWGDSDRVMAPVYGDAFRERIAGATLTTIADAGHMAPYEKTGEVIAAIARTT